MGGPGKGKGQGKGQGGKGGKGLGGKGLGGKGPGGKGKGKGKGKASTWTAVEAKGDSKAQKWVEVKPTVLVTGASGYLAMSIIKRLLNARYRVRGTIRSLKDEKKVLLLKRLFPDLELFEADLTSGVEPFAKAAEGCKYLIHVASVAVLECEDPVKELYEPTVQGTEAVMQAAIKAGVSRVVLTSTMSAVGPNAYAYGGEPRLEKVFTEEDWNDVDTLETQPYMYAKVQAERRAWEIAKEAGLQLVTLQPGFIIGPPLCDRTDALSIQFIKMMLEGKLVKEESPFKKLPYGYPSAVVDVRDASLAHVNAMEIPEAAGHRFLLTTEKLYSRKDLVEMIRERFKAYPIATDSPDQPLGWTYDHSLATRILKFNPRPVEVSMIDMANAAIRLGIVQRRYVLKPVKFGQVAQVLPDSRGVDLLAKVVEVKEPQETKSGASFTEVVVGDATGIVTLRLFGNESADIKADDVIEVRNAAVKMIGGYIRLQVGKWGNLKKHEGGTEVTPNKEKDVSATEYELICA